MSPTSPASSDNDNQDEIMEDVDLDAEPYENDSEYSRDKDSDDDGDDGDDGDDADGDAEGEQDAEGDMDVDGDNDGDGDGDDNDEDTRNAASRRRGASPPPARPLPTLRPGAATASSYDIVPYVAAPHATSINAFCATPCMKWIFTGGNDGYIRKFDWFNSINGKTPLTVAQRHPFVDSVTRAGYTLSYWENEEPAVKNSFLHIPESTDDARLSPVYSLAVHNQALWMLSGLESGGINLQSVRHDEGKLITCLRKHTSAVSVLTLGEDEQSLLSGSWDKTVCDWDLNKGQVVREYTGSAGQISAIQFRPLGQGTMSIPKQSLLNGVSGGNGSSIRGTSTSRQTNGTNGASGAPATNMSMDSSFNGGGTEGTAQAASPAASDHSFGSLFGEDGDDEFGAAVAANGMNNDSGTPQDDDDQPNDQASGGDAGDAGGDAPAAGEQEQASNGLDTEMDDTDALFGDDALTNPIDPPPAPTAQQTNGYTAGSAASNNHNNNNTPSPQNYDPTPPSPSSPRSSSPSPPPTPPTNTNTFLASSMDGTLRIWDRRSPTPVALALPQKGVPPWCTSAVWSTDGNYVYAGRRNCTVEEYSIHKGFRESVRTLKFPQGSGPVSAVSAMPNGRHLLCASFDNVRLYDLKESSVNSKHSLVPFLIVPGHHGGVISCLYVDATCQFVISTGGNRGWEGANTEVLLGYDIGLIP
ncbi:WD40-repeat-containing domain protein [Peziza echinospora]|nr:WD40-repeat-containing domain protein [Peziza echinospora]